MYGRSATKRCIDKSGSRAGNWGLLRCDAAALEQRIKALPLYLSHAVLGMRAAGDGPNRRSLPKPSRFVGSNQLPPVTRSPGGDACPDGLAAIDAPWGVRAGHAARFPSASTGIGGGCGGSSFRAGNEDD